MYDLQSTSNIVCVADGPGSYGFVGRDHNQFKCFSCRYDTHNCCHIQYLLDQLESDTGMVPEVVYEMINGSESNTSRYNGPVVHSHNAIPFHLPASIKDILKNGLSSVSELNKCNNETTMHLIPSVTGACSVCGEPWDNVNPVEAHWFEESVVVLSLNNAFDCKGK